MRKQFIIVLVAILFFSPLIQLANAQGQFVGSKNSDVYHYPSCSYVSSIKPENKVWFADAKEAVNRGYHPCSRCNPPLPINNNPTTIPTPTTNPPPTPTPMPPTPSATPDPTSGSPLATPTVPEVSTVALILTMSIILSVALIAKKKP